MEHLIILLKKAADAITRKAVQGVKNAVSKIKSIIKEPFQSGKDGTKGKKSHWKLILTVLVCVGCILLAGAGIFVLVSVMVIVSPVAALYGIIMAVFGSGMELENQIDTYWNLYKQDYGTEYEIKNATQTDQLLFLLGYDDFWEDTSSYFQFDKETMTAICTYAESGEYLERDSITSEVMLYTTTRQELKAVSAEEWAYETNTPVYIYVAEHDLDWQILYSVLAGCTDEVTVDDETIKTLASGLKPETDLSSDLSGKTLGWSTLLGMDFVEEGPFSVDEDVYQIVNGEIRTGGTDTFLRGGVYRKSSELSYQRLCPVMSYETITCWDGTLTYVTADEFDFEKSDSSVVNAVSNAGLTLDVDKAVASAITLTDGYANAIRLSDVISDGTISMGANDAYTTVLEMFVGQEDLLESILSALGINISVGTSDDYSSGTETDGGYYVFDAIGNGPDVIWWSQQWYPNSPYGTSGSTVSGNGCGPSSLAIVYSSLTGDIWSPPEAAKWCTEKGYVAYNSSGEAVGPYTIFSKATIEIGLRVDYTGCGSKDLDTALEYLDDGDLIVCVVGCNAKNNPIFTGSGHFLVIRGVTEDGKLILADPNGGVERSLNTVYDKADMEEILERPNKNGYIWAIGYDE